MDESGAPPPPQFVIAHQPILAQGSWTLCTARVHWSAGVRWWGGNMAESYERHRDSLPSLSCLMTAFAGNLIDGIACFHICFPVEFHFQLHKVLAILEILTQLSLPWYIVQNSPFFSRIAWFFRNLRILIPAQLMLITLPTTHVYPY